MASKQASFNQETSSSNHSKQFCLNLLHQMTLDEKVGQMVQVDLSWKEDIKTLVRNGRIGSLLTIKDPHTINEYQHLAVDESRLKIPLLVGNDIIHGYRTIFPIPLALASSWDLDLIEQVASASIAEAISSGTTLNYAPMVDISRDPRWGRIAESAGEDPFLSSQIARAWVKGNQSYRDAEGRSAAACVKHFAAYGGAESGKDYDSVDMSERRLREEYLPPYHAAVQAGVKAIMTSFNDLNGLPATANPKLLQQILRKEWGFSGVITSDFDSIRELVLHGFAHDLKEAALRSILAGIDIDMMGDAYHLHLADLVREGKVPESLINEAVIRILTLKYELGLFKHPYIEESNVSHAVFQNPTLALAEKAAARSIVLLKNTHGLLPLTSHVKKIALIGPLASEQVSLMGCWNFDGHVDEVETLYEAMQRNLPEHVQLQYNQGCSLDGDDIDLTSALETSKNADIIVVALGENEVMSGEAHSRAHLDLPGHQMELFNGLAATGIPVVTLLFAGRPLAIPDLVKKTASLLLVWHGGTRAAQGICDVLLGTVSPGGKLPVTFPISVGQIPIYYAHKNTGRPIESTGTIQFNTAHRSSYIDESNDPLFPFGFGLSYTTFLYSDFQVSTPKIERNGILRVSATITNSGNFPSEEIVQLYIRDLVGMVTRPVKELKGFQKIKLKPGESRRVEFFLPASELSFLDINLQPIIEPGKFKVWIAPDSSQGLEGSFEVRY